jgi:uncharacterized Zn finger protein (UPF0148 family)
MSTDENVPTHCEECEQPLLYRRPGRTVCSKCRPEGDREMYEPPRRDG